MKYLVLVGDGMADYAISALGNKTPLEVAKTPWMDFLVQKGELGLVRTIPKKMPKGSDVAALSILGYNPKKYYTGRGPLEARALNIKVNQNETVFRCNLVNISEGKMLDHSAGHISSDEAKKLIKCLNDHLDNKKIRFYAGVSYRHILVIEGDFNKMKFVPPHDILEKPIKNYLPKGRNKKLLIELIKQSQELFKNHPINKKRQNKGLNSANSIWPWGQGKPPQLPTFKSKYHLSGSIISAVDLIKGIGKYAGLDIINVPGATGYIDTNYKGKVEATIESLKKKDFALLHIEAPDEASHQGNLELKIKAIENFDKKVVGEILKKIKKISSFKILVMCDHATPICLRTHTDDVVPFAIYSSLGKTHPSLKNYNEKEAQKTSLYFNKGDKLLDYFFKKNLL